MRLGCDLQRNYLVMYFFKTSDLLRRIDQKETDDFIDDFFDWLGVPLTVDWSKEDAFLVDFSRSVLGVTFLRIV